MSPTRTNVPITDWEAGDTVAGFALLARKERRQDRNGRDYLDLELSDASGSIIAKAWSDSPALDGDYDGHDFVAFKGTVKSFRDQLQLNLLDCRRANDADRRHGFDEARLVPTTPYDIEELWRRLEEIFTSRIRRDELRRLAEETLAAHGAELREHPAAKIIHHAYRGGLLEHVVSMAELAIAIAGHYQELDLDLLLVGVLFHDLGKLHELGAMPRNEYTEPGRMVGHVVIGRDLLRERCAALPDFPADLQLHLEHLVLSHQGRLEFGSPVQPMTAEAIALHFIDDLDSKLAQLRRAASEGPGFRWLRGFGRMLRVSGGEEEVEEEEPSPEADDSQDEAQEPQARLEL
jgi:3'-5' exoribonuclease